MWPLRKRTVPESAKPVAHKSPTSTTVIQIDLIDNRQAARAHIRLDAIRSADVVGEHMCLTFTDYERTP